MSSRARWTRWDSKALTAALERTPVVVLHGGRSSEREVSLRSGHAVVEALEREPPPASVRGVELDERGRWLVNGDALEPGAALDALPANAIFFLGLHGGDGEDGRIQGLLELARRTYTGSPPLASARCMDKHTARLLFADAGLEVAPAWLATPTTRTTALTALERDADAGGGPWYVKPRCGGSSVLTFRVTEAAELAPAIDEILASGDDALVERCITGLEVTCAVFGNRGESPTSLPLVEILPKAGRFFDYEEKYNADGAVEVCPPEHLAPGAAANVESAARKAYEVAGCEGYARIDFIVPESGGPVALEANTLPGLTERSLLPLAAAATGVSFRELCLEICALALERGRGATTHDT